MHLRFVDKGTILQIHEQTDNQEPERVFNAVFYDVVSDVSILVESQELYERFSENLNVTVIFFRMDRVYTFNAKITGIVRSGSAFLSQLIQVSSLVESTRRKYDRYEMLINVRFYGLTRDQNGNPGISKASNDVEFSGETFDISAGGICIVSNLRFSSEYEPYFLAEFNLGDKDIFLLPVNLLRKGKSTKTVLFRYEYGFLFLYDNLPKEKDRLADSIFSTRLSRLNR